MQKNDSIKLPSRKFPLHAPNRSLFRAVSGIFLLFLLFLAAGTAGLHANELKVLWQLAPDERSYVGTSHTERGMAFNPATGNLLLVSRAGGINVVVLDAATGNELRLLSVDGISGGTFPLNMIGVADDGAVYAGNLVVAPSSGAAVTFKLYRWDNDSADSFPTLVFEGDPMGVNEATGLSNNAQRWGDSIAVTGSGNNTRIAVPSRSSANVAIFTTQDGANFTPTILTNAAAGAGTLGVSFGAGNTLWTKSINVPLRHIEYDLAAGTATLLHEIKDPVIPNTITAIGINPEAKLLGGVAIATPDHFRLYDLSVLPDLPLLDQQDFATDNANPNNTASVDWGKVAGTNAVFALASNNGLLAMHVVPTPPSPPTIATQPQNQTVLQGSDAAFSVTASGTPPFSYQWQLNGTDISGATNSNLRITKAQPSDAGSYTVVVSNAVGSLTSNAATLTVTPLVTSAILEPLWQIAPGDRPYVGTDNNQRGMAYNPSTGNVLLVSRTGGNNIYVLDGATGTELRRLTIDTSIVFGGTFVLNMIGVADDGAVYAANLVTDSAASRLAIYRWENDSADAIPTVAFLDDPSLGDAAATNRRFGDSMDVRGAGTNTQILMASRAGTIAVVFTTTDGVTFEPNVIRTDAAAGDLGLGVAFGEGNSFWATAPARPVRHIDFDLAAGTGTTRHVLGAAEIATSIVTLTVDPANKMLAGIAVETPDNLRLYDFSKLPEAPVLVDQELLPTDNPNVNGTGAADFGGGRLYALNSNNGLIALQYNPNATPTPAAATLSSPSRQGNGTFQFTLTGTAGAAYIIQATSDFQTWTDVETVTAGPNGSVQVRDQGAVGQPHRFYRARAK